VRSRFRPWHAAVLALLLIGAAAAAYLYFRNADRLTTADLLAYLPPGDANILYADVKALRGSGLLDLLAGRGIAEEADYRNFVQQTGFDYRQDLDTVLLALQPDQTFALLRGRFHWDRLRQYVAKQGGECHDDFCRVMGSQPSRRISFYPVKRGLMALAISPQEWAATQLTPHRPVAVPITIPPQPVWVSLSPAELRKGKNLPSGTRLFALALENADQLTFSISPEGNRFAVQMNVACRSPQDAAALTRQLDGITDTLRKLISREKQTPNPSDLSAVLVAGTFRQEDRRVYGRWPVERAFLESISNGAGR
jgi:hypothetical protein